MLQNLTAAHCLRALGALACAFLLVSCGGGGDNRVELPKAGVPLFTSATGTIVLETGASATHTVGGGGSGASATAYSAFSNNTAVASATIEGNKLSIKGLAAGSASISVRDSSGSGETVVIPVTVAGAATGNPGTPTTPGTTIPFYSSAQASLTIEVGETPSYLIAGGAGAYYVSTDNARVARATVTGNTLRLQALAPGNATIAAVDSVGARLAIAVIVPGATTPGTASALYTTAQNAITVAQGSSTSFAVSGGVGPYVITTDNTAIATATVAGNTMTIKAVGFGKANVRLSDADNSSTTISVNVGTATMLYTTAPDSVTIKMGESPSYTILGGVAPYVATSSAAGTATVTLAGNVMTIKGIADGSANVNVLDTAGNVITVSVTVPEPPQP
jgi:hypothetical protein